MSISRRMSLVIATTLLVLALAVTTAVATPITVNLRIEGSTQTLYEGPVTSNRCSTRQGSNRNPAATIRVT